MEIIFFILMSGNVFGNEKYFLTGIHSMTKETKVIVHESSVSSSGSIKIPIYRVDL